MVVLMYYYWLMECAEYACYNVRCCYMYACYDYANKDLLLDRGLKLVDRTTSSSGIIYI